MSLAVLADRAPFVRTVRCRTVANTLSIGFDVRREVEEGEQRFPILRQAGDRLLVLSPIFVGEHIDRRLGTGRLGREGCEGMHHPKRHLNAP